MFDIGWSEMLVVAVVAIIVVGPKDLPRMLRALGKTVGQIKRQANEFKAQFDDALRDSEIDEIKSTLDGVVKENPVTEFEKAIKDDFDEIEASYRKQALAKEPTPEHLKDDEQQSARVEDDFEDDGAVAGDEGDAPKASAEDETKKVAAKAANENAA